MARCLGSNPPYGCGHFREHQLAAYKGWKTRRYGEAFKSSDEHAAISALFGGTISHAHEHPSHQGLVRFKEGRKWYEVTSTAWRRMVREGVTLQREQALERKIAARQQKQLEAVRRAEYQEVTRTIRAAGGIRPYKASGTSGKRPELEEWRDLPRTVKNTRSRAALDDMAATIAEHFPWLNIQTGSDLGTYLQEQHRRAV